MLQASAVKRQHSHPSESSMAKRNRTSSLTVTCAESGSGSALLPILYLHQIHSVQSDDTESFHSYQGYETALVKDSSDDLWFLDEASEEEVSSRNHGSSNSAVRIPTSHGVNGDEEEEFDEFEILSSTSSELSETSSAILGGIVSADEVFVGYWGSSSEDDWADLSADGGAEDEEDGWASANDSDQVRFQRDKWYCEQCNRLNTPLSRRCEQCWRMRPGWLPEPATELDQQRRQRSWHRRREQRKQRLVRGVGGSSAQPAQDPSAVAIAAAAASTGENSRLSSNPGTATSAGTAASSQSTAGSRTRTQSEASGSDLSSDDDENRACTLSQVAGDVRSSERRRQQQQGFGSQCTSFERFRYACCCAKHADELCMVCLSRKKDASIVHGSTGHQVCCYTCARNLMARERPCPVCRRTIQKVIRNYFMS